MPEASQKLGSMILVKATIFPICTAAPSIHSTVVAVTLPSLFTLPRSQFNEFLFASIGPEGNGMPLSVVSALARLEIDPWLEAARLADLPKERAAAALDGLIRRLPAGGWDEAETPTIVARLIELLPRRAGAARPDAARPDAASPSRRQKASSSAIVWLIVVALGAAVLIGALADGAQRWNEPGASAGLTNGVRPSAQP
jgi:hypothetical protein